ncbi:Cyclopropane-fatty-acyl-phospholipid synthase [Panicum miliaceum]|uniref:Cyclopropane-fatty-acyl-phospholipid synthase n=1 Tax=Panicum miliaceum TaxID=4540 RepID=A0A3L6SEQ5_PANMI|nr:Cyclopropane-fatty-acyl-phospholipid synthase [Panicum miliaceum]
MSLSVSTRLDGGGFVEWGSRNGISSLLARKSNSLSPSFWRMIHEICKFKNHALRYLEDHESNPDLGPDETLEQFVHSHGYSKLFQDAYLVKEDLENMGCQIKTSCEVKSISSFEGGYKILEVDGAEVYDKIILAVHAPDALKLLGAEATHDELRILGAFQYTNSDVYLHNDRSLMPRCSSAWSTMNFLGTTSRGACVTYWLNLLQNIESSKPFLVTLNPPCVPDHVLYKWYTSQPIPSVTAAKAYLALDIIQGKRGIWFCGAYKGYGFHEDGVKAGKAAAADLLGKKCDLLVNPKQLLPSWTEAGARLLVARFLDQYISIGNLRRVHVATEADIGLADAYINGYFSFVDNREGLLNLLLSNDFFALFLDPTMNYSSRIFKARVERDHHVLEIGSGWGTLAIKVVKRTGCKYTGITLSHEQLKYAQRKVKEVGLEFISIPEERIEHIENIGYHYYTTLMRWRDNFMANRDKVLALGFDDKFIRTWEYYFIYCASGFKSHTLGDYQIIFSRPGNVKLPNYVAFA